MKIFNDIYPVKVAKRLFAVLQRGSLLPCVETGRSSIFDTFLSDFHSWKSCRGIPKGERLWLIGAFLVECNVA
jgi:hypothetical protein